MYLHVLGRLLRAVPWVRCLSDLVAFSGSEVSSIPDAQWVAVMFREHMRAVKHVRPAVLLDYLIVEFSCALLGLPVFRTLQRAVSDVTD